VKPISTSVSRIPSILDETEGEIRSETPFLIARIVQDGDTDIFATGRYLDMYRIEDGRARLNERTVVCDSSRIDTLMALPL
jgi:anthranilate 1,2-dioxygenase small subunit